MESDETPEGISPDEYLDMVGNSKNLRIQFLALTQAGFTEDQSLKYLAFFVTAIGMGMQGNERPPDH